MKIELADTDATENLGRVLARSIPAHAVMYLSGDIGAGKSTLARALLRELGVTGPIKSPTYTLIERYPLAVGEAAHLDLYRIVSATELDFLGLDDVAQNAVLWLVEWPERGQGLLPKADLSIDLLVKGNGRTARVVTGTENGAVWMALAAQMLGLRASS